MPVDKWCFDCSSRRTYFQVLAKDLWGRDYSHLPICFLKFSMMFFDEDYCFLHYHVHKNEPSALPIQFS